MDPLTLSAVSAVLLKAGPSLLRTVGGWFGGGAAGTAASVAGIIEAVSDAVSPQDRQRILEQTLAQLPPEKLIQLETLKVELERILSDGKKALLADQQAAHTEQQTTIRNGDNATDDYVRQTRPLLARLSLYGCIAYVLLLVLGQQAAAIATARGLALTMPAPDWDIALMLLTPALGYLGFRTLDGFARFSKSSKHKTPAGLK
ncbi:hypothetical protein C3433_18110 [Citrobacter freundii]|nr:hypothetical protein C3433_18110 [Citrobacter freundii]